MSTLYKKTSLSCYIASMLVFAGASAHAEVLTSGDAVITFDNGNVGIRDKVRSGSLGGSTSGSVIINDGSTVLLDTFDSNAQANKLFGPQIAIGDVEANTGFLGVTGPTTALELHAGSTTDGSFEIGSNGGTGTLDISNGASVHYSASTPNIEGYWRFVDVGVNGGTGSILVDNASMSADISGDTSFQLNVGRQGDGNGNINLTNAASFSLSHDGTAGDLVWSIGWANNPDPLGAGGEVVVNQSFAEVTSLNTDSRVSVGSRCCSGSSTPENATEPTGRLTVIGSDALFTIHSENKTAAMGIGQTNAGEANGTVEVSEGAKLEISSGLGTARIATGQGGSLSVTNQASVSVSSDVGNAIIGTEQGGSLSVTNQASMSVSAERVANIRNYDGTLVIDNSVVTINSANMAGMNLHGPSKSDTLFTNESQVSVFGGNRSDVRIGDRGNTGAITITNGSDLLIESGTKSRFRVGVSVAGPEGGSGTAIISNGATVTVTDDNNMSGNVEIGRTNFEDRTTDTEIEPSPSNPDYYGSDGFVTVTGSGSRLNAFGKIFVGGLSDVPDEEANRGELTVADGATVFARSGLELGGNSLLTGHAGFIDADVLLRGGSIAPGASPGRMDILGDLAYQRGFLEFEIAGAEFADFDFLSIGGDLILSSPLNVSLSFLDGYVPEKGTIFEIMSIGGSVFDNLGNTLSLSEIGILNFSVSGLIGSDFDFLFENGLLFVETVEGGSVAPVPLPGALSFLITALGSFGLLQVFRRRLTNS